MQCPADGDGLVAMSRDGIEVDYCPTCRGVWLDRGELDKIIERSVEDVPRGWPVLDRFERPERPEHDAPKPPRPLLAEIFDVS